VSDEKQADGNPCPECGGKPETTTQNADTGAEAFQCAEGHIWGEVTA
jgi:hypothetical protein